MTAAQFQDAETRRKFDAVQAMLEARERALSPFAARGAISRGRERPEQGRAMADHASRLLTRPRHEPGRIDQHATVITHRQPVARHPQGIADNRAGQTAAVVVRHGVGG